MSRPQLIIAAVAVATMGCHGGKPASSSTTPVTVSTPAAGTGSTSAPTPDPESAAELALLEEAFQREAAPPLRGGGREEKDMAAVAAQQDRECHARCDKVLFDDKGGNQAAQDQNLGAEGLCRQRCGCMAGARQSFIGCMRGAQTESDRDACRRDNTAAHAACKTETKFDK